MRPVEQRAPACGTEQRVSDARLRQQVKRLGPWNDDQGHTLRSSGEGCGKRGADAFDLSRRLEAEKIEERCSADVEKRWVETLLASAESDAVSLLDAAAAPRLASVMAVISSFIGARIAREHQIGATLAAAAFQPGLFDRRVHHAIAAARAAQQEIAEASARRLTNLEHRARLSVVRPTLRLVLVP